MGGRLLTEHIVSLEEAPVFFLLCLKLTAGALLSQYLGFNVGMSWGQDNVCWGGGIYAHVLHIIWLVFIERELCAKAVCIIAFNPHNNSMWEELSKLLL